jgi:ankyrin repeat protein
MREDSAQCWCQCELQKLVRNDAIHCAAIVAVSHPQAIPLIAAAGADLNAINEEGATALMMAIQAETPIIEAVRALISRRRCQRNE